MTRSVQHPVHRRAPSPKHTNELRPILNTRSWINTPMRPILVPTIVRPALKSGGKRRVVSRTSLPVWVPVAQSLVPVGFSRSKTIGSKCWECPLKRATIFLVSAVRGSCNRPSFIFPKSTTVKPRFPTETPMTCVYESFERRALSPVPVPAWL